MNYKTHLFPERSATKSKYLSSGSNILEQTIIKLAKIKNPATREYDVAKYSAARILKLKDGKIPKKSELLKVYHSLLKKGKIKQNQNLEKILRRRAVRTLSGVTIIAVLTKPFPCPGRCVYCPFEAGMPKSYLSTEPAAARGLRLKFDPYDQVSLRIRALADNGHPTEKIELIIKGGTWNFYPLSYQYWFINECFRACNNRKAKLKENKNLESLKKDLLSEQKKNEKAKHRIIGLTLETRPDYINEENIKTMREFGCTRIELGVQTTDNKVLKLVRRDHTVEDVKEATRQLKNFGFKVDYHIMPQLPSSTAKKDLQILSSIFENPGLRPDMIKIYPCTVIKNSLLYEWHKNGKYHTYSTKKLIEILIKFKTEIIPYYARISRLIRDIPSKQIEAGNKVTNLRQIIHDKMEKENLFCRCLRCREIGHQKKLPRHLAPKLFIEKYDASGGTEYFLSFEDKNRQAVFAFCRLRIGGKNFPAFIRELHTYGQSLPIGLAETRASQHKGLGRKLMDKALKICQENNVNELAVISGIGVREYYKTLGYNLKEGYLVKKL